MRVGEPIATIRMRTTLLLMKLLQYAHAQILFILITIKSRQHKLCEQ